MAKGVSPRAVALWNVEAVEGLRLFLTTSFRLTIDKIAGRVTSASFPGEIERYL